MTLDKKEWFTEVQDRYGVAFSLKIEEHLHSEKSDYQQIDIYQTSTFGKLMTLDGCTMVSDRENFIYHEMLTHPALFSHPAAKKVAIIGGGDCGTLREVLKHASVEEAIQVEIDERVTRLSEQYFPALCESNDDPRAKLMFIDGVAWMAEIEQESLDLIIIDSTDPVGPAEGLFGPEFLENACKALRNGGILIQQTESPLLHMDILMETRYNMMQAGFVTTQTLFFPQPIYPSGWWSATMARKGADLAGFREMGAASRDFETRYYNVETHKAALALPEFVKKTFKSSR